MTFSLYTVCQESRSSENRPNRAFSAIKRRSIVFTLDFSQLSINLSSMSDNREAKCRKDWVDIFRWLRIPQIKSDTTQLVQSLNLKIWKILFCIEFSCVQAIISNQFIFEVDIVPDPETFVIEVSKNNFNTSVILNSYKLLVVVEFMGVCLAHAYKCQILLRSLQQSLRVNLFLQKWI